ncbi:hypothetical protein CRYUN_Cryun03dG0110300 [Craigia yunnanensis]
MLEMLYIWLFVASLFAVSLTNWIYRWKNPKCNGKLPPGSMGFPLIGETLNFLVTGKSIDIHPFVKERMLRYGPLFKTSLLGRPVVVTSDPDFSYFVFQQEEKLVELYYMDSFAKMLNHDTTSVGGIVHKYIRRLILSNIGAVPLKDLLLPQLEDAINHRLNEWAKLPEVELKTQSASMILEFVAKTLISYEPQNSKEDLIQNMTKFGQGVLMTVPLYIPGTAFYKSAKSQQKIIKLITELVEVRIKSYPEGRKGDFLDEIVEDIGKEEFLTKEFVIYVIFGLFFASFETISSTLTLAIKYVFDNPSVLQQLTEEHEEILKKREDPNSGLLWEEYKSMTYTHYVINETLRLASVAPGLLRRTIKDIHIKGYVIPKGWIIMVAPSALQLDPNVYENPLTFNPSRWKNIESNATVKNFMPFGGGNRHCAGADFAKVLMTVFFHVIVTKYRLTKTKGGDVVRTPLLGFGEGFYVEVSGKQKA